MKKKIEVTYSRAKIGELDRHYYDGDGNVIGHLLRNTNGIGYRVMFEPHILIHESIEVGSQPHGFYLFKEALSKGGYEVYYDPNRPIV